MTNTSISRRKFLKIAAVGGAAAASCRGAAWIGNYRAPVSLPEIHPETGESITKKILIAYSSICGSTAEVAVEIVKTLGARGSSVEVWPLAEVKDHSPYSAVLTDSAVRMGRWPPEAKTFLEKNVAVLSGKRLAHFQVGVSLTEGTADGEERARNAIAPILELLPPADYALFAGKADPAKLTLIEQLIGRMVKTPVGDYRDWDAICNWADEVYPKLVA